MPMKKISRWVGAASVLGLGISLVTVTVALAANVDVAEDVTITLPGDGSSYTLTGDSLFDSFEVNSASISFTMSGGHRVVLKSSARTLLGNTINTTTQCSASESTVTLELPTGSASQTVTVTPSGNCSSGGGGGGGGGGCGGGGGSNVGVYTSSTPSGTTQTSAASLQSKIAELQSKIAVLLQQIEAIKKGQPAPGVVISAIAKSLRLGSRGNDVNLLQTILAKDKEVYPEGTISGYFGRLTESAVKRFQVKYGIAGPGEPGYGLVGPKTRAKLNALGL